MKHTKEGVVVLHGALRTHRGMGGLARFLEGQGFDVLNLGYPSTRHPLEGLVDFVHPRIEDFARVQRRLHFVGYSMGGLLTRAYIHKHKPAALARVVMLAVPNKGSEVADYLKDVGVYKWLYGPAGQQLITDQAAFAFLFGAVDYEMGVIAGNRSIDPVSSRIIGIENDGKVSVESTRIGGMKEHIVIPSSHTFFPSSKTAWRQTAAFLREGSFRDHGE